MLLEKRAAFQSSSENLRRSVGLRSADVTWPRSFAPLVSLYALLQAEPFLARLPVAARQACLPHLLLLVHTFVEDRHLDGQRPATRGELLFSKQLFCDGQSLLRAVADDASWAQTCIDRAAETYGRSELFSFRTNGSVEDWQNVRAAVAGRAKLAGLTAECLLRLAGASDDQLAAANAAFDGLVVGLQWEDDLVDWRDDVATHSDNLLLWRLGQATGEVPATPEEVARAFDANGITTQAIAAARVEWTAAAALQRDLGATQLAGLIEDRIARLEALGERTLDTI